MVLGVGTLTSFVYTILLMGNQKFSPIAAWYKTASQLEAWAVFYTVFLGDNGFHPTTYEIFLLPEETSRVIPGLRVQARQKPTFSDAILCLIQQEFNKIFRQVLGGRQRVRWPNLEILRMALATGNCFQS